MNERKTKGLTNLNSDENIIRDTCVSLARMYFSQFAAISCYICLQQNVGHFVCEESDYGSILFIYLITKPYSNATRVSWSHATLGFNEIIVSQHVTLIYWINSTGTKVQRNRTRSKMCSYILKCWSRVYIRVASFVTTLPATNGINSSPPGQNGRHFADDIFSCILVNETCCIVNKSSLKFVPNGPIDNNPALVEIMAWRRIGDKPLSEPMLTRFTDAYVQHSWKMS